MKILFIGDYSNLHACLAHELRNQGHQVDVLSDGCGYMQTHSDFHIERQPGIKGGFAYLFRLFSLLPKLKGYDVVQLINSNFLSLRPGKIKYFFDRLRDSNGSVFLTLAGNDYYFVKACHDEKFRFSEFKIGDQPTNFLKADPEHMYGWISAANRNWSEYLYERINGAMSVLPEYDLAAKPVLGDKLQFTNLPIDLSQLPYSKLTELQPLRLFIGIRGGMEIQKGTSRLLAIAKDLEREFPDKISVESVRNLSLKDYLEKMKHSHIVLDQLYSYSPATNALQAMALGRIAASGAQPEFYEYIGNPEVKPVFSLAPTDEDIPQRILHLADNPELISKMSVEGRKLVKKNNDVKIVAPRFVKHWEKFS